MSERLGGLSYEGEALSFGAPYDTAQDVPVELRLLTGEAQQEKPLAMLRMLLERQRMMRKRLLDTLPVKLAKLPKVPPALLLALPKKRGEWQRMLLVRWRREPLG